MAMTSPPRPEKKPSSETRLQTISLRITRYLTQAAQRLWRKESARILVCTTPDSGGQEHMKPEGLRLGFGFRPDCEGQGRTRGSRPCSPVQPDEFSNRKCRMSWLAAR